MTTGAKCPNCSRQTAPDWQLCPYCGAALGKQAGIEFAELVTHGEPPILRPAPQWKAEIAQETHRDTTFVGIGLLVFGLLLFGAGVTYLLRRNLLGSWSIETLYTVVVLIGGLSITAVLGGLFMIRDRSSQASGVATGVLGGVLSVIMAGTLFGLITLATLVYAIADCLKACGP